MLFLNSPKFAISVTQMPVVYSFAVRIRNEGVNHLVPMEEGTMKVELN